MPDVRSAEEHTTAEGSARRSWSQFDSWRKCPKSFELSRIHNVPRRPGVWLPAGTAVHAAIERYLRERLSDAQEATSAR